MEDKNTKTRRNPLDFFNGLLVELRAIEWPSRSRTVQLTSVVIVASIVFGLLIGGLDYILTIILENIVNLRG